LKPNETLEPIRNYHGLFSSVLHLGKNWDFFAYYGGEYAQRTVYTTGEGALIGYGPRNLNDTGCYNLPAPVATAAERRDRSRPPTALRRRSTSRKRWVDSSGALSTARLWPPAVLGDL
jgi:hypothetical protein